jgi:hypothetical protein
MEETLAKSEGNFREKKALTSDKSCNKLYKIEAQQRLGSK